MFRGRSFLLNITLRGEHEGRGRGHDFESQNELLWVEPFVLVAQNVFLVSDRNGLLTNGCLVVVGTRSASMTWLQELPWTGYMRAGYATIAVTRRTGYRVLAWINVPS